MAFRNVLPSWLRIAHSAAIIMTTVAMAGLEVGWMIWNLRRKPIYARINAALATSVRRPASR